MKRLSLLILVLFTVLLFGGCSKQVPAAVFSTPGQSFSSASAPALELNLSAAASLTDVMKAINHAYVGERPNFKISANFASSGMLQKQIEQGAPADIFISAGAAQMDALQNEKLLIDSSRKDLLVNKVVLIVPLDSQLEIRSFMDLTSPSVSRIAVGDPKSVPAGTYAREAFDLLGITSQLQPKLVIGADVRQVLAYVESGNVDAGIVYATDALLSTRVKVVASAPDAINARVVYPVAVLKNSPEVAAAQQYVDYLFTKSAEEIFTRYGFTALTK